MRLVARDYRTLEHVFAARYLTNKQIAALEYKPSTYSWCKERLAWMTENKFLGARKGLESQPYIYYLRLRGKRYVATLGGHSKDEIDKIAGVDGGLEPPMDHDLQVSSLYVRALLECRENGWQLHWRNARMLELKKLGVQPDAYLSVTTPVKTYEAFIEYTKVIPGAPELARKLAGYQRLYNGLKRGIPILWLADSQNGLQRLAEGVRKYLYNDYVMLGRYEDAHHYLTAFIWRWGSETVGFIAP
jgi:hypothetical protein